MKKNLIKAIKTLDFFSVDLGFKIKQEDKYGTLIGGIVFMMYIIITLYFVIVSFISFINRTTFNQNTIENNLNYGPKINILDPKMHFAFGLSVNGIVDDSFQDYLNITLKYVTIDKLKNTKIKNLIITNKCKKNDFIEPIFHEFDLIHLENYSCIDKSQYNSSLVIQGIYTEVKFTYLEYSAKVNFDKLTDQIKEFFYKNEIKLEFYYLDSSINISDYHKPEKPYLNFKYIQLSYLFTFRTNVDFANNTFINDANILLPDETEFHFYTPLGYETMSSFIGDGRLDENNDDYDLFARMYIRTANKSIIMRRVYQKFPDFLADATSIVSQLLMILMVIFEAYDRFRAEECVINGIMQYKQKLSSKTPNEYKTLKALFSPQFNSISNKSNNKLNNNKETSIQYSLVNNRNSNISFLNKKNTIGDSINNPINLLNQHTILEDKKDFNGGKINFKDTIINSKQSFQFSILNKFESFSSKKSHSEENMTMKYNLCDLIKLIGLKAGIKSQIQYKKKMHDKGMNYYLRNLDIFYYFNKMREIDLIKYLLFEMNEINLINFLLKPSISTLISDDNNPMKTSQKGFEMTIDNINQVSKSFNNIYERNQKDSESNERCEKFIQQTAYEIYQLIH